MVTPFLAQTALAFGVNDLEGTMVREKIYHEAGATTPQKVQRAELVQWIRDAGRVPVESDTLYNVVWSEDESLARSGEHAPVGS
jgi:aminodeoxyfutalosine synthase